MVAHPKPKGLLPSKSARAVGSECVPPGGNRGCVSCATIKWRGGLGFAQSHLQRIREARMGKDAERGDFSQTKIFVGGNEGRETRMISSRRKRKTKNRYNSRAIFDTSENCVRRKCCPLLERGGRNLSRQRWFVVNPIVSLFRGKKITKPLD